MMKTIILIMALATSAAAGPYYDLTMHSSSSTLKVSGDIKIAASSSSANSPTIRLNGAAGSVTASSLVGPLTGAASSNVLKAGDTMTGTLTAPDFSATYGVLSSTFVARHYQSGNGTDFTMDRTGLDWNCGGVSCADEAGINFSSSKGFNFIPGNGTVNQVRIDDSGNAIFRSSVTANLLSVTGNLLAAASVQANILQTNTIYPTNTLNITGSGDYHYTNIGVAGLMVGGVEVISQSRVFTGSGSGITGVVQKAGDTMTGQLTLSGSTLTVTGNAFSVGGSTLVVAGGKVGIGIATPQRLLEVYGTGTQGNILVANSTTGGGADDGLHIYNVSNAAYIINQEADTLNLGANNSVDMTILSDGKVGIGTTSPGSTLHVAGDATISTSLTTSSMTATGKGQFGDTVSIFKTEGILLDSTLSADSYGYHRISNVGGTARTFMGIEATIPAGVYTGSLANASFLVTGAATPLQFGTNATANMTILNGGNVGIGTTGPAKLLEMGGASALFGSSSNGSGNGNDLTISAGFGTGGGNTGGNLYIGSGRGNSTATSGKIFLGLSQATDVVGLNATAMTIVSDGGNVGIGTTNPTSTIGYGTNLVHQYGQAPAYIIENSVGTATKWEIGANTGGFLTIGSGSTSNGLVIKNNGNVGIGNTAPQTKLDISSGTIHMAGTGTPSVGAALCLTSAGTLGTCTGGTFTACTCTAP